MKYKKIFKVFDTQSLKNKGIFVVLQLVMNDNKSKSQKVSIIHIHSFSPQLCK